MKIAFMHIPKTGGISIERSLRAGLSSQTTTCPAYFAPEYEGRTYADLPGYGVYQGHFDMDFLRSVPADYLRLIVLRNPQEQVLSLCNHIASRPKHKLFEQAQGATLAELLDNNKSLHNLMARYLLGRCRYREILETGRPPKEKLELAREEVLLNLGSFDLIGVTARIGQFIRRAQSLIDTPLPAPKRENRNPFITYSPENLSEADQKALQHASWADRPLFREIWRAGLIPDPENPNANPKD